MGTAPKSTPRLFGVGLRFVLFCCTSCGGPGLATPPVFVGAGERSPDEAVVASHARPAALPEVVPPAPSDSAAWLSGHWDWSGSDWIWRRGGWIENPDGLKLVRSRTEYTQEGTLLFFDEHWVKKDGTRVDAPEIVAPAATPPTPVLAEDATIP